MCSMAEASILEIGRVATFFAKASAAAIRLTAPLHVGDRVYIRGMTTDFQETIESMQVDHQPVSEALAGQLVGIKVRQRCRRHDIVYKIAMQDAGG